MQYTNHYNSTFGKLLMASDGEALTGLWVENQKNYASTLEEEHEEKNLEIFEQTKFWLDLYFGGNIPKFTPKMKFIGTDFQKQVWKIIGTIPYGKTISYGDIANQLSETMSAQAVGNAVSQNPILIINPCHRVIGKNENLTGYAGGIDMKLRLLTHEDKKMLNYKQQIIICG